MKKNQIFIKCGTEYKEMTFFSFTVPGLNVFEIWLIFNMDHLPPFV